MSNFLDNEFWISFERLVKDESLILNSVFFKIVFYNWPIHKTYTFIFTAAITKWFQDAASKQ